LRCEIAIMPPLIVREDAQPLRLLCSSAEEAVGRATRTETCEVTNEPSIGAN
jgi:hypothetical protein